MTFSIARILSSTAQLVICFLLKSILLLRILEWVPQDITDDSDPLRQQHETVEIHGIPPPKRIKHIWKKQTKAKFQFTQRIFEWAPDTFCHHQLESVQQEQLKIHVQSITPTNMEQQSDYYDRSKAVFLFCLRSLFLGSPTWSSLLCLTYLCNTWYEEVKWTGHGVHSHYLQHL